MFMNDSTKMYRTLHISKFVAVILFALTPILAGITAGLMMHTWLFWTWIGVGVLCLSWFIVAVVMTNRLKHTPVVPLRNTAAQRI